MTGRSAAGSGSALRRSLRLRRHLGCRHLSDARALPEKDKRSHWAGTSPEIHGYSRPVCGPRVVDEDSSGFRRMFWREAKLPRPRIHPAPLLPLATSPCCSCGRRYFVQRPSPSVTRRLASTRYFSRYWRVRRGRSPFNSSAIFWNVTLPGWRHIAASMASSSFSGIRFAIHDFFIAHIRQFSYEMRN